MSSFPHDRNRRVLPQNDDPARYCERTRKQILDKLESEYHFKISDARFSDDESKKISSALYGYTTTNGEEFDRLIRDHEHISNLPLGEPQPELIQEQCHEIIKLYLDSFLTEKTAQSHLAAFIKESRTKASQDPQKRTVGDSTVDKVNDLMIQHSHLVRTEAVSRLCSCGFNETSSNQIVDKLEKFAERTYKEIKGPDPYLLKLFDKATCTSKER